MWKKESIKYYDFLINLILDKRLAQSQFNLSYVEKRIDLYQPKVLAMEKKSAELVREKVLFKKKPKRKGER